MDSRVWKLASIILSAIVFIALIFVIIFGLRLSNVNQIKAAEMDKALKDQQTQLTNAFQSEKEVSTVTYKAEDVFGNFTFSYPKVWATNVKRTDSDPQLQFLADPDLIIMRDDYGPTTALRVMVNNDKYADKLTAIEGENSSKNPNMQEEDITLSGLKGKKFHGTTEESGKRNLAYVILPLRDKTLYIGTDDLDNFSKQYDYVLKSFTISK